MVEFYATFSQNTAHIDSLIRVALLPALLHFSFASVSQKQTAMKSALTHSVFMDWALERGIQLGRGNEHIHVEGNATEDSRETWALLPERPPVEVAKPL